MTLLIRWDTALSGHAKVPTKWKISKGSSMEMVAEIPFGAEGKKRVWINGYKNCVVYSQPFRGSSSNKILSYEIYISCFKKSSWKFPDDDSGQKSNPKTFEYALITPSTDSRGRFTVNGLNYHVDFD